MTWQFTHSTEANRFLQNQPQFQAPEVRQQYIKAAGGWSGISDLVINPEPILLDADATMRSGWVLQKRDLTLLLLLVTAPLTLESTQLQAPTGPDLRSIVQSLGDARRRDSALLRPYRVTREYSVFRRDSKQPTSEVTAQIGFVPGGRSTYEITHASGNSRVEKIVRKILDRETRSTKGNQYSDISERNYEFVFVRQENVNGQGTYMLRLIPKRKQTGLLNGFVWVDQKTFRIWRIEGTPARTPSWWIKRLYITLQFAEVKGMWLHTSLKVTAFVRFFGKYVLIGHDVPGQTVAENISR